MTEPTNKRYKNWESTQRKAFREGKLSKAQIKKLTDAGFVFELPDTAAENKAKLLEMARNGEPKPDKKTQLGARFRSYIYELRSGYDESFKNEIRKINPSWVETRLDVVSNNIKRIFEIARNGSPKPSPKTRLGKWFFRYVEKSEDDSSVSSFLQELKLIAPSWFIKSYDENKSELLRLAKQGGPRPSQKTKLGRHLSNYLSREIHNQEFIKELRQLNPLWFVMPSAIANKKKEELILMAERGDNRPVRGTKLGESLCGYLRKSHECYDEEFEKLLRIKNPDWFITKYDISKEKKEKLLKMAERGDAKPSPQTKLGLIFRNYTYKKSESYDADFERRIRKINPSWFIVQHDVVRDRKQILLKMAIKKQERPKMTTKLGQALCRYISEDHKCYDYGFKSKIQEIAPFWFSDKVLSKKSLLLEIAASGKSRPSCHTSPIGQALLRYTSKNTNAYDPEFDAKIRALRPDWFKRGGK